MKRLTCEMCGSTDFLKEDGVFVCQSCGCKYSVEEAKKMMVEGVVEVTGTVSVDTSDAIKHNLELARTASASGNNTQAEERADEILSMNTNVWEAWFIKGYSANYESTYSNDRLAEALNCYKKAMDGLAENLDSITCHEIALLGNMLKELILAPSSRISLYGKFFERTPNEEHTMMLTKLLPTQIDSIASLIHHMAALFKDAEDAFKISCQREGVDESTALNVLKKITSPELKVGELYFHSLLKLMPLAIQAQNSLKDRLKSDSIFDYYGTDFHDFTRESNFLAEIRIHAGNIISVFQTALSFAIQPNVDDVIRIYNRYAEAVNTLTGDKLNAAADPLNTADLLIDHIIMELNFILSARTRRRYHNRYSTGGVTNDGCILNESGKKMYEQQKLDILKIKDQIHKDAQQRAQQRREQERAEQAEANRKYWEDHPEEKKQLEAEINKAQEQINVLDSSIADIEKQMGQIEARLTGGVPSSEIYENALSRIETLQTERNNLGMFKIKEKKRLSELIDAEQERCAEIKKQMEIEIDERNQRIATELKPYQAKIDALKNERSKAESRKTIAMGELKANH